MAAHTALTPDVTLDVVYTQSPRYAVWFLGL